MDNTVKEEPNGAVQQQKEELQVAEVRVPGVPGVPARAVEEDASLLQLGPEFDQSVGAQPLFIAEVAHLLKIQVEGKSKDSDYEASLNPVLRKALDYTNRFNQLDSTEQAIAVREQLAKVVPELHPFEIAQLASLMPKEAEEAKAIIPSLGEKYDDDVLNEMLKNMDAWL